MSIRGIGIVLVLFVLGIGFSGFASYSSSAITEKKEVTVDGKKLAAQNCASCHGKDLHGSGIAPDLHQKGAKLSEETIAQVIRDGVGSNMPAMPGGLKDEKEVTAIAKYIVSLGDSEKK